MPDPLELPPTRLFDVVDGILQALREFAADGGDANRHPLQLLGAVDQPKALCPFTRFEVEQASAFLERMGMLESASRG